MDRRSKFTPEEKLEIAKRCFHGELSRADAVKKYGISKTLLRSWIVCYREQGAAGFARTGKKKVYSPELKLQAVLDYLDGKGSYMEIAAKYGLRSDRDLRSWMKVYNSGRDFSRKTSGGSRMTTSRKTTQTERIAIVKDCLANGRNYGETAIKYNVSYQQVYTWVKRFTELGEAGLEDRRGKRKANQEPRSEVEELKIRMARLEHELYMTKMERDLLKKLDELERGDASHK